MKFYFGNLITTKRAIMVITDNYEEFCNTYHNGLIEEIEKLKKERDFWEEENGNIEYCNGVCCERRPMMGSSWWKNLGFGSPCKCAYTESRKETEAEQNGNIERLCNLNKKLKEKVVETKDYNELKEFKKLTEEECGASAVMEDMMNKINKEENKLKEFKKLIEEEKKLLKEAIIEDFSYFGSDYRSNCGDLLTQILDNIGMSFIIGIDIDRDIIYKLGVDEEVSGDSDSD